MSDSNDPDVLRAELDRMTHLEAQACANLDAEQAKVKTLQQAHSDLSHTVLLSIVEEARQGEAPALGVHFTEYGLACAIGRVVMKRLGLDPP